MFLRAEVSESDIHGWTEVTISNCAWKVLFSLPTESLMFLGAFKGPWRFKLHKNRFHRLRPQKGLFWCIDWAPKTSVGQGDSQAQRLWYLISYNENPYDHVSQGGLRKHKKKVLENYLLYINCRNRCGGGRGIVSVHVLYPEVTTRFWVFGSTLHIKKDSTFLALNAEGFLKFIA